MNKHISEEDIQQYRDDNLSKLRIEQIAQHIAICQSCKLKFQHYTELYYLLGKDSGFELSPDFSQKIVASIDKSSSRKQYAGLWDFLFVFIAIILGIGITFYFAGPEWYAINLNKTMIVNINHDFAWLSNVKSFLSGFNFSLFFGAILILILTSLFDEVFVKNKFKASKLHKV